MFYTNSDGRMNVTKILQSLDTSGKSHNMKFSGIELRLMWVDSTTYRYQQATTCALCLLPQRHTNRVTATCSICTTGATRTTVACRTPSAFLPQPSHVLTFLLLFTQSLLLIKLSQWRTTLSSNIHLCRRFSTSGPPAVLCAFFTLHETEVYSTALSISDTTRGSS